MINGQKIILDLCGGTVAWSKLYKDQCIRNRQKNIREEYSRRSAKLWGYNEKAKAR